MKEKGNKQRRYWERGKLEGEVENKNKEGRENNGGKWGEWVVEEGKEKEREVGKEQRKEKSNGTIKCYIGQRVSTIININFRSYI